MKKIRPKIWISLAILTLITLGLLVAIRRNLWGIGAIGIPKSPVTAPSLKEPDYADDRFLVKFQNVPSDDQINTKLKDNIGQAAKSIKKPFGDHAQFNNIFLINVDTDTPTAALQKGSPKDAKQIKQAKLDEFINSMRSDDDVIYAERDLIYETQIEPNDPYYKSTGAWGQTYPDMWGLPKIQASSAWDITTGSDSVIVAVTDTGVDYNLPEIKDNILRDDSGNIVGYDFANDDTDPMDDHGHGTHVSGTIAAVTNNALGIAGVAWKTKIIPVKVFSAGGSGYASDIAPGIIWGVDHGGRISNNSWGGSGANQTITDAVQYAYTKGELFVAAAGNANLGTSLFHPANLEQALTISAFDWTDNKASFSNYGTKMDVAAPGVNILSLKATTSPMCTAEHTVGTNYCYVSGTSMASPHVSGLAALILAKNPSWTNEQVRQAIRKGADDVDQAGLDINSGFGRINAYRALQVVEPLASKILSKQPDATNPNLFSFSGIAAGPNFASFELSWGRSVGGTTWTTFARSSQPVTSGFLGKLDTTSLQNDYIIIKLTAKNLQGESFIDVIELPAFASVKGKVIDAVTKKPLQKVVIYIFNPLAAARLKTDRNGNYTSPKLPVSRDIKAGYQMAESLRGYYGLPVYNLFLDPGETRTIDIKMTGYRDFGTATGKVTNAATGQPLGNINVSFMVTMSPPGANPTKSIILCGSYTAIDGTYSCPLAEGSYVVDVYDYSRQYEEIWREDVYVAAKQITTLNFPLTPKGTIIPEI